MNTFEDKLSAGHSRRQTQFYKCKASRLMHSEMAIFSAWSASTVEIYRQWKQGETECLSIPRKMKADLRYFLKFYRFDDGSLLLRSGDGDGTCLDVVNGKPCPHPMEDLPEVLSANPPYKVIPLRDGTIAGISSTLPRLILWRPGTPFRVCELPEGFMTRDVDRDNQKRLWICGSVPTQSLKSSKYRRALAASDDDGISWHVYDVVHGGLRVAWHSLLSGAESTYRTIAVFDNYVVLSAESDGYDDTSSFLFVRNARGGWKSGVLKGDILRSVLSVGCGELEIISHYGQAVLITPRNEWQHQSLLPRIRNLMQAVDKRPPEDARYEILDAQATPTGRRILVVSVQVPERKQLARFGEAVVILSITGDSLVTFHGQNNSEITTANYTY